MAYKKHIFLCSNLRAEGQCCQMHNASEMVEYLKKKLKELGLTKENGFRVSSSGCMGYCKRGPALVIYPEGKWYTYKNKQDIDDIIFNSIQNNYTVEHLIINDSKSTKLDIAETSLT